MRHVDILIVGGGLAGSTAAAMLGRRAGIDVAIVDPHETYPTDFRCEKLDPGQVALLRRTGLAAAVLPATAGAKTLRVARMGRILDDKPGAQNGILYDALVNALRAAIPAHVPFIHAKVTGIETSVDRQTVTLSTGETISARLVVLASGLHPGLLHHLDLTRVELSHCHSITIGFDVKPVGADAFPFEALTWYPDSPADRAAYLTLFPIKGGMRANYMVYRDLNDPWLSALRKDPAAALRAVMPGLDAALGPFEVTGTLRIRPADLYATEGYIQPGIVLVGDAFATSCPAAGTGSGKVFTDVERLCNVHIPAWLGSPGMEAAKVAAFYADPVKRAADDHSIALAWNLKRRSIDLGLRWRLDRLARFALRYGIGVLRRAPSIIAERLSRPAKPPQDSGTAAEAPEASHV